MGNNLTLTGLTGTESIAVEFPIVETTETYYLVPWELEQPWFIQMGEYETIAEYILHFKGNTCIKADFTNRDHFLIGYSDMRQDELNTYPVYQREHYRKNKAPTKTVTRYIAPKVVSW